MLAPFTFEAFPSNSPMNVIVIFGRKKNKSMAAHVPLLNSKAGNGHV
jgi:hypothetical protein